MAKYIVTLKKELIPDLQNTDINDFSVEYQEGKESDFVSEFKVAFKIAVKASSINSSKREGWLSTIDSFDASKLEDMKDKGWLEKKLKN